VRLIVLVSKMKPNALHSRERNSTRIIEPQPSDPFLYAAIPALRKILRRYWIPNHVRNRGHGTYCCQGLRSGCQQITVKEALTRSGVSRISPVRPRAALWISQSEMNGGEVTVSRRLVREGSTNPPNVLEQQGLSPCWLVGLVKSAVAAVCCANEVPLATPIS
jgi:hypothetical protein